MFLRNERSLGVKNGSLGVVESVSTTRMAVMMDDGRSVAFDVKDYADVDHGYAATIHKSQGVTVDRVHVLATPGLDRHASYVALSRHRDSVDLHYGRDDFADQGKLVRTLARERSKDMASDYAGSFAERRQIIRRGIEVAQPTRERPSQKARSMFDGLRLTSPEAPAPSRDPFAGLKLSMKPIDVEQDREKAMSEAVQRVARATGDILRMRGQGMEELPHQRLSLEKARKGLDEVRPHASTDLRQAFARDRRFVEEAAKGRTANAIRAMQLETEIRLDPDRRADRFASDFQRMHRQVRRLEEAGDRRGGDALRQQMIGMAKGLERDPELESRLRKRSSSMGIPAREDRPLSQTISDWLGPSRSRGIGR
jgi:hypothetical protein